MFHLYRSTGFSLDTRTGYHLNSQSLHILASGLPKRSVIFQDKTYLNMAPSVFVAFPRQQCRQRCIPLFRMLYIWEKFFTLFISLEPHNSTSCRNYHSHATDEKTEAWRSQDSEPFLSLLFLSSSFSMAN